MKKAIFILLLGTLFLTSCADAIDISQHLPPDPYGFWGGLWHGIISPFAFICSLFLEDVAVYAINNTGGWYDFGFLIGISCLGLGSKKAKK